MAKLDQDVRKSCIIPALKRKLALVTGFKASIDFRAIRENLETIRQNVRDRNSSADPDQVCNLYDEWRQLEDEAGRLRSERNQNSKAMKGKMEQERRAELIEQGKALKEQVAELEARLSHVQAALQLEGQRLPNLTHPEVPRGVLEKCGFQPRAENTQVYSIMDSSLCLTGTAEVPLGGLYMDQIIPEEQLPIKLAGFGHCFRTEAGAAGAASKGLYRVHQFSKVELFVLCTPSQSEAVLDELKAFEEDLFTQLGLHFKVLDMPTGDLGAPAYRKFDIEAWMPGLQRYGEISSASNCTDYQSRRLNIRFRPGTSPADKKSASGSKGKVSTEFVHTLNATACAVPRLIVAILENFQQADGSVLVPPPLQPFMGGMTKIRAPEQVN
ncbi:hypothetical protein WJX73_000344 [Symbiochloris irregularis]|uniref:serine--tRNA ligase n=1 Tax=Symbiochloris irregularis TaxID=706552 RepID=A0AAW1PKY1_9CHLO